MLHLISSVCGHFPILINLLFELLEFSVSKTKLQLHLWYPSKYKVYLYEKVQ